LLLMKKERNFLGEIGKRVEEPFGIYLRGNPDYCHKLTLSILGGWKWLYEWTRVTPNGGED